MSTYEPLPGEDAPAFARRVFAALQRETGACFWLTRRMGKRFSYVAGTCREPREAPKCVHLAGDWYLFLSVPVAAVAEHALLSRLKPVFQLHFSRVSGKDPDWTG